MCTRNQKVVKIMQLTKLKQDIILQPLQSCVDEYDAACEEEATIHYINEEIQLLSKSLDV